MAERAISPTSSRRLKLVKPPGAVDQSPYVAAAFLALVEALEVGALEGEVGRGRLLDPDLEVLAAAGELLTDPCEVLLKLGMGGDCHARKL